MGQALVVFVQGVPAVPPLAQAVAAGLNGQHRCGNAFVDGQGLVRAVQLRAGDLVGGVAQDFPLPLRVGPRPVLGQPLGLVFGQSGLVFIRRRATPSALS